METTIDAREIKVSVSDGYPCSSAVSFLFQFQRLFKFLNQSSFNQVQSVIRNKQLVLPHGWSTTIRCCLSPVHPHHPWTTAMPWIDHRRTRKSAWTIDREDGKGKKGETVFWSDVTTPSLHYIIAACHCLTLLSSSSPCSWLRIHELGRSEIVLCAISCVFLLLLDNQLNKVLYLITRIHEFIRSNQAIRFN